MTFTLKTKCVQTINNVQTKSLKNNKNLHQMQYLVAQWKVS